VLPNASNCLYRITIKKDQMSSYMNPQVSIDPRTPRRSFEEFKNSDIKTLDFKHPIYHMDFCHHTGFGVFFSSPSSDKYLTDEKCDELMQLNFMSKDLVHMPTTLNFASLTPKLNHDILGHPQSNQRLNSSFESIKNSSIQT